MRIILCEGKTDAILLSYYLEKTSGWQYNNKPKKLKLKFSANENCGIYHYKKDNMELAICSVGGKDNFINFYSEYIHRYIIDSESDELEYKIAIVTDRDDGSIAEIERYFSENLSSSIPAINNNEWKTNFISNTFGQKIVILSLLLVIPQDKQGALENLLMDALSEDKYKGNLINKSKEFVDKISPEATEIITTDRLKLKTKLGVSLAVLYPEKVFSLIDEQLKSVDWEKTKVINECFEKIINI